MKLQCYEISAKRTTYSVSQALPVSWKGSRRVPSQILARFGTMDANPNGSRPLGRLNLGRSDVSCSSDVLDRSTFKLHECRAPLVGFVDIPYSRIHTPCAHETILGRAAQHRRCRNKVREQPERHEIIDSDQSNLSLFSDNKLKYILSGISEIRETHFMIPLKIGPR